MIHSLKKRPVVLAALLATLAAPSLQAMPLEEELRAVLGHHPLLKANRHAIEAAGLRVEAAQAAAMPRLVVSADAGREGIVTESYKPDAQMRLGDNGTVRPATESDLTRRRVGLSLEQSLYNGGRTTATQDLAGTDRALQNANLQALTQDVLLEALTAYLQVARFQTLIGLTRLNEDTTRQQLELETRRAAGGGGIVVDVMQARSRLQIVKERRVFYEQQLRDALANYEQAFGHAPDLARFQDVQIYEGGLPASLPAALDAGLQQSARLAAAKLQVQRSQGQISLERAGFKPSVDLVLARNNEHNVSASAARNDWSAVVRLNWAFNLGGETFHREAAALRDQEELMEREVSTRNKVREAIRIAWNQVVNGKERLELLESAAGIARDVMNDRKRLRDAGKETALSALDAEVEYFGVLANKVNAQYDVRIGAYRLMAAVGSLTPANLGLDAGGLRLPVQPLVVDMKTLTGESPRP
ncbi:TolC family protein [Ideonella livida]|uniref:TolC family protein n=1 Tax=Ideonella livida TaxID=2707176 RepID=A0A7C9PFU4_9BURK|nr:TolC family protein [Ideonella livida]NDY90856.1 TolC family protein [Ideonella livida]